eukprot:CAMPEP_0115723066 /NCGR_PEP_ID=MMETSP0272-20121206/80035_1 /TAXON_ID=71861 /ORGANISM="Scrippsiella trochoidea, Strain CCMP3099" /LENGTH=63 /DNA_ID=CAMNT_0003166175 /DNA_START=29 /DNA_END=216 /DNA_ORIENTATION=+
MTLSWMTVASASATATNCNLSASSLLDCPNKANQELAAKAMIKTLRRDNVCSGPDAGNGSVAT